MFILFIKELIRFHFLGERVVRASNRFRNRGVTRDAFYHRISRGCTQLQRAKGKSEPAIPNP
jgi:hypothetical protein